MSALELLAGTGSAFIGLTMGFVAGRVNRRPPKPPKPAPQPKAICGCSHHLSMHDPKTNQCHGQVRGEAIKYDAYHSPTAYAKVQCTCRQYSGPIPADQYFTPKLIT